MIAARLPTIDALEVADVEPGLHFVHKIDATDLDGVLMANSLHFQRDKAPVLALSGERDHIHPPATVIQVAERLGGDFRALKEMSHWLVAEPGWEAAAEVCLDWLTAKGCLEA